MLHSLQPAEIPEGITGSSAHVLSTFSVQVMGMPLAVHVCSTCVSVTDAQCYYKAVSLAGCSCCSG